MSVMRAEESDPQVLAQAHEELGKLAGVLGRFHERARAALDVVEEVPCAGGRLLGDYRGADEGQGVHRASRVAEGVDLLVRRREVPGLDYGETDLLDLARETLLGEVAGEAGDGLQLVYRAAGRAETPSRELGHGRPAGGHYGQRRQAHLVPDAARGVLVHALGERVSLAGFGHRPRQRERLLVVHPLDEDRHEQGGHLVVGNLSRGVALHHGLDQALGEFPAGLLGLYGIEYCVYRVHTVTASLSSRRHSSGCMDLRLPTRRSCLEACLSLHRATPRPMLRGRRSLL